jgi:hypothetical protein
VEAEEFCAHPRGEAVHPGANPGFRADVAVSSNYLDTKTGQKVLATSIIARAFERADYDLHDKTYSSRRIQQSQGPGMGRLNNWAKRNRVTLTDIAEVMTFRRRAAG